MPPSSRLGNVPFKQQPSMPNLSPKKICVRFIRVRSETFGKLNCERIRRMRYQAWVVPRYPTIVCRSSSKQLSLGAMKSTASKVVRDSSRSFRNKEPGLGLSRSGLRSPALISDLGTVPYSDPEHAVGSNFNSGRVFDICQSSGINIQSFGWRFVVERQIRGSEFSTPAHSLAGYCGAYTPHTMYPNPFDRKHSTIRQVIDRLLKGDKIGIRKEKNALSRKSSNDSSCSSSSSSAPPPSSFPRVNDLSRAPLVTLFSITKHIFSSALHTRYETTGQIASAGRAAPYITPYDGRGAIGPNLGELYYICTAIFVFVTRLSKKRVRRPRVAENLRRERIELPQALAQGREHHAPP
ncbi:hypothetical protein EVAR_8795_1 [Eumeta japonica]|uniref:Uncharacterized protein n=1 Tax=Eumeta variegata TaxID=151549 RepID=A0A4C1TU56_EUMVA|nr:hypothetical protein EVAR_8795_1 [Eumeta japonica]